MVENAGKSNYACKKNSENFIKIILKIKQKLQNITERLMITVLLNKVICAETIGNNVNIIL
jgi:hypothetical protein